MSFSSHFDLCQNTKKARFTKEDDNKLLLLVQKLGTKNWIEISQQMGSFSTRQCRERYRQYIDPNLKIGNWTTEEDEQIVEGFFQYGFKWFSIAKMLHRRSPISIRSRFYLLIKETTKELTRNYDQNPNIKNE
jgi:hypothetical protein